MSKKAKKEETTTTNDSATLAGILASHEALRKAKGQLDEAEKKKITPKDRLSKLEQAIKDSEEVADPQERLDSILGDYKELMVKKEETYNAYNKAKDYYTERLAAFEKLFEDAKQAELPFEETAEA